MVEDICYRNAERYFGLEVGQFGAKPAAKKKRGRENEFAGDAAAKSVQAMAVS